MANINVRFPGFYGGAGTDHVVLRNGPGGLETDASYLIGENFDGRYGGPGPREVVDRTGIAANFTVRAACKHGDVDWIVTSDGTDTKVYRIETAVWALKLTRTSAVGTGIVSFKDVVAVGYNTTRAYEYSTDDGSNWVVSTKTAGNAEKFKYAVVQVNGLTAPRVVYGLDPSELYTTEDLTNTDGTGITPTYIWDTAADQNFFGNLVEDYTGEILCCMRHDIFSVDSAGRVWRRTWENFPDGIAEAGGAGNRHNFEVAIKLKGRIYFNYAGRNLMEWHQGRINLDFAPWQMNSRIPRMQLPINAGCAAGGYVVLFIGSKNTATTHAVTYAEGGTVHIGNTFSAVSEMWIGRYVNIDGAERFVWHGVLLTASNLLRFAWWDEDDGYLYMGSGDAESADLSQTRCLFYQDNPFLHLNTNIILSTATWKVDTGRFDFGSPFTQKTAKRLRLSTLGLGTPTISVLHKLTSPHDTSAFSTLKAFDSNAIAEQGVEFPAQPRALFKTAHLEFDGTGSGNSYAVLIEGELEIEQSPEFEKRPVRRMR